MTPEEKNKLKKQYESFTDGQISQMIFDGPQAYVEGAYELLQEEARRRGLEIGEPPAEEVKIFEEQPGGQPQPDVNTYMQLAIINNQSDRSFIASLFDGTDIPYFFQNLHIRQDIDLPAGLMVDSLRVEESIELLKDFKPSSSILLW
jgi:hypothetical protein